MTTLPNLDDLARLAREYEKHCDPVGQTRIDAMDAYLDARKAFEDAASPAVVVGLVRIAQAAHKMARKSCDMGEHTEVPTDDFDALMELLFSAFPAQPREATNE